MVASVSSVLHVWNSCRMCSSQSCASLVCSADSSLITFLAPRSLGKGVMTPPDQLPAVIPPTALATPADTYLVPALIADLGDQAGWRYVEFFTANIRNPNTRRAYARACGQFFAWCDDRGLSLTTIRPHDVNTYLETLQQTHAAPGVKQQLAAVRMLFDWLITGQVTPSNPASAVRGPKHVVKTGKTPVLEGE